jgi:hypothetical protein
LKQTNNKNKKTTNNKKLTTEDYLIFNLTFCDSIILYLEFPCYIPLDVIDIVSEYMVATVCILEVGSEICAQVTYMNELLIEILFYA